MLTGVDRTRNNGIFILLKVTKVSNRGTCPQNKPTNKKSKKITLKEGKKEERL